MATRVPVIATVTIPENGKGDVKYEIIREVGPNADWHNRYVLNPVTNVRAPYKVPTSKHILMNRKSSITAKGNQIMH